MSQGPHPGHGDSAQNVGLCARCQHARVIPHPNGGPPYWRCEVSGPDNALPRYPRLPVAHCREFEAAAQDGG